MYSNPPAFGARIVGTILNDEGLRKDWYECIKIMSNRILRMRRALFDELTRLETPGTWNHIIEQIGMFSYTGLNGKCGAMRIIVKRYIELWLGLHKKRKKILQQWQISPPMCLHSI